MYHFLLLWCDWLMFHISILKFLSQLFDHIFSFSLLPGDSDNVFPYSEVPNRRADQNKQAGLEKSGTLLAYLLSKLINEQGGIFHFTK